MQRHVVSIPESAFGRNARRMTPNEFLVEFADRRGKSSVFTLRPSVRLVSLTEDRRKVSGTYRDSQALFRALHAIAGARSVVLSVAGRGVWHLDGQGLYSLNHALRTPAVRKGGLNIVRHFLESRAGSRTALRGDFDSLLSFLEIRPVFRVKTPKAPKISPTPELETAPESGIYYVSCNKGHNVKDLGGKKRPHASK